MSPEGPGTAADWFAGLQRAARPRRWLTAAVIGATGGLFTTLVLAWPLELLAGAAITGTLLLWDRRHGHLAGWSPSEHGPYRIAAVAARLERQGWAFLPVPEPSAPYCYLLIGPQGVFLIQHEHRPISTDVHNGLVVVGERPAIRDLQALRVTADAVQAALRALADGEGAVQCVLVAERTALEEPRVVTDVTILPVAGLRTWLCRRDPALSQETIASLAVAAHQFFDEATGQA
jgi:hypothetical protein